MGVMECDRNSCTEICCLYHSNEYGNLCESCFVEMKLSRLTIRDFMATYKEADREPTFDYDSEFYKTQEANDGHE